MSLEQFIHRYEESAEITALSTILNTHQKAIIKGLSGSMPAILQAAYFQKNKGSHLILCNDKESAAYFLNDIQHCLDRKDIYFLPDSYKREGEYEGTLPIQVNQRIEAINQLCSSLQKTKIVVTYPAALLEKVVQKKAINDRAILLKIGDTLHADSLMESLIENGFEHVDFVYEPGQFSLRGGIIDIYSYANEYPYRIELYDTEIESIRLFDPSSQLSLKKIEALSIVPDIQTQFGDNQKTNLFEIIDTDCTIWVEDIAVFNEHLERLFDKRIQYIQKKENCTEVEALTYYAHDNISTSVFIEKLQSFPVVLFGGKGFDLFPVLQHKNVAEITQTFSSTPHPSFNKNFELLIQTLQKNTSKGFQNCLFSENPKQIERFQAIFDDLKATVEYTPVFSAIHEGFEDETNKIIAYTDHQIFNRFHRYKTRQGYSSGQALLLKTLKDLTTGDFVTHIDHGVGRYSGLETIEVGGQKQEAVRIIYSNNDILYVNISSLHKISKYVGKDGVEPKLSRLGSDTWANIKRKTKKKIKDIAEDLIKLYAQRKNQKGFAYSPDSYLQTELESSFMYEDTPDQIKATADVKSDMERDRPMDRLVCGDVGFGKTEIAIRAAFKAVCDGKQVAVLVPTTILAYQHFQTFSERLKELPCTVDYLNRFKTTKQKNETLEKLKAGKVDIIIGTHGVVGKQVEFKDLGLLIIDEEQKFGVAVKEKIKALKVNVDSLTLTATPIPRTLQFSLLGARDLSTIQTPPPNRLPVHTEVHTLNADVIKEAIEQEIYRGGQVFFVHNKVSDLADIKVMLQKIVPNVDIAMAHGQLEGDKLEEILLDFVDRKYDVLLSTNIIEAGIDIPNANTIIINNAHWFGMSDLHQLRGRVGRSNKKAFCYLLSPPQSTLTQEARQRLRTIEQFSELGSGFQVAMRDLDIRGAGNLLGGEQSGFISEIGYDAYHKILDEAIAELKETDYKGLYKEEITKEGRDYARDCAIEADMEMRIPDNYVKSIQERLSLYTEMNTINTEEELVAFATKLVDRFGKMPRAVHELLNGVKLKWAAKKLGIEKIVLKNNMMRCYLVPQETSVFYDSPMFGNVLAYVQAYPVNTKMRPLEKNMIIDFLHISTLKDAQNKLTHIVQFGQPVSTASSIA